MSFSQLERVIATFNAMVGGVLDTDPAVQWYESVNPFEFVLSKGKVWTESDTLRANPAANLSAAQAAAAGPLAGIVDDLSLAANAIRLTPLPGVNNGWIALTTYGDFSSVRLDNWVQPAFVPQSNGLPSTGYSARLFEGDPNSGGTEILTTDGTTGTGETKSVGWLFFYPLGLLLTADDFSSFTDPYVNGFRYIGEVAGSGGGLEFDLAIYQTGAFTPAANKIHKLDPKTIGPFSVTMPVASGFSNGDVVGFKYVVATANQVTLNRSGSDLIEGQTSFLMNQPHGALIFGTDGVSSWWII